MTVHSALNTNVLVTVLDANGPIMPGKAVVALRSNGTTAGTATTNANGVATLLLAEDTYRFRVTDAGIAFYSGAVVHCQTPGCTSATITIPHVDVTLVDTNGAPLVNHTIAAETTTSEVSWISTDATGKARFALPVNSYRFSDEMNGYTFFSGAAGHCTVPSCTTATIVETLPVTVTVRDTAGAPQSGREVVWSNGQGAMGGWMITNATGVAMLSPAQGSITFTITGTTFSNTPACVVPGCTSASITVSQPVTVTVRDTAGTALSGSSVRWETTDGATGGATNTNASGQATLTPPLQPVRFRVTLDGTTFYSGAAGHCVQPACTTAAISVTQQTVVTLVDGSGVPISGRAVTPTSTEGITSTNKTTNASGQATFRLPVAHWRFTATCTANSEVFYSGDAGHCVPGGCLTAAIKMPCGQCAGQSTTGLACDDQNPCSTTSHCLNQRCTADNAKSCPGDACHDAGACNAQTGACVNAAKPNGTICNDANPCKEFDVCQDGVCQGSKPHVCKYVGQCRDPGTCNSAATISTTPPATSDLVAWWHMDGNGDDATGGGHNLTVEGNVVTSPGRFGKAMTFDGTSCMTTPSWAAADLAGASGVTMMAWVNHGTGFTCPWPGPAYPDSQKGQMVGAIMGKGFDYSMGAWCGGQPGDGTQPGITLGSRPAGWQTWGYGGPAGVVPGPDDWALVTVVWDRISGIAQYVNGQGVGGWPLQADIGNLFSTFGVGCFVDDAAHGNQRIKNYIGTIDEVMVYKRALSYQEIRDYYFAADPCSRTNKPAGTYCVDYNACTQTDACDGAGECAGSNPLVCSAGACETPGTCNPGTGYCSDPPRLTDGTNCEEGNRCSVGDQCHAGTCTPGLDTGCSAAGASHYASVMDLGGTRGYSFAQGINSRGDVVGTDTLPTLALYEGPQSGSRAFRWTETGGLDYLPEVPGQTTSYAKGINDAGVIAGSMSIGGSGLFPYRYDPSTNPLPQAQSAGFGRRINAAGTMTGGYYFSSGLRMFRIGTGALEELPAIPDSDPVAMQTWGEDISVDGTVVGTHVTTGGGREALRYGSHGAESLNSLLPQDSGWTLAEAFGINQQTIVGWGTLDGQGRAFRMTVTPEGAFAGIIDLGIPAGFLPEWDNVVIAHRSNASGEVVGAVYDQWPYWPQAAFVYTDATGIVLLNSLLDPQSGWNLLAAFDINDNHQVVGYGYHNGQVRPFRMTLPDLSPCPPVSDGCHQQTGTRNLLTGVCSYDPFPDGTVCTVTGDPAVVTGFEALGRWTIGAPETGTIVGLNANHTQGSTSLEVTAQNYLALDSINMSSLGPVGPLVLLDIFLPSQQANPDWFGTVDLFANAPSVGVNNVSLGQVELSALPLATWQTLAFRPTPELVTALSASYSDLTLRIGLNVPSNETGHYLFDNLRFTEDVVPSLIGIADNSVGVTKAIFTHTTSATSTIEIPYGPANTFSDERGLIHVPLELPPQHFVSGTHPPFAATLAGNQLTWTVGGNSVTATRASTRLPTETASDGTRSAVLPDGTRLPLDLVDAAVAHAIQPSDTSYTQIDSILDLLNGGPPIGPTASGTLEGRFHVADDGSAEYVLPLDMPAGRGGVQPSLALVYNSRAGSGVLGPGWSLRGLKRITRCKRPYGLGAEQHLPPAAIKYDSSDTLCMEGERLVMVGPGEYRTKRDQQSKIVVTSSDSSGPVTFTVYRKDGIIEYYGDGAARATTTRLSSIMISPAQSVGFSPVTREWLMSHMVDRYGNTLTATYDFPTFSVSNIQIKGPGLPKTLSYTSNLTTHRTATKTVTFVYVDAATMAVTKFESGVPVGSGGKILTEINVSAPRPVAPGLVTKYKLTYDSANTITDRSLLKRVQRCGGDGTCMAPTLFSYSPGSYGVRPVVSQINDFHPGTQQYNSLSLDLEATTRHLVAGDIDGDGREDLLYRTFVAPGTTSAHAVDNIKATEPVYRLGGADDFGESHGAGLTITQTETVDGNQGLRDNNVLVPPILADITGDGKADLIMTYLENRGSVRPYKRYDMMENDFRNGVADFKPLPAGVSFSGWSDPHQNPDEGTSLQYDGSIILADVNGDGLLDIGRQLFINSDTAYLGIRPNQNGILGPYQTVLSGASWGYYSDPVNLILGEQFAVDLDGDGRTEIVMQQSDKEHSFGVNGTDANGSPTYHRISTNVPFASLEYEKKLLMDVNGDGLRDVLFSHSLWLNTGTGFLPVSGLDNTPFIEGLVDDVNSDGMEDVFVPSCSANASGTAAVAYISKGDGTFVLHAMNIGPGLKIGKVCPHVLMDVDGDGQKDYVQPEFGSDNLHIYFRSAQKADRMTKVTNGVKAGVAVDYTRYLARPTDLCRYPLACGGRNVEVVSGYTVDEGQVVPGQAATTHYSMEYAGPSADAQGGGWIGFETVKTTNDRTHATDKKYFNQLFNLWISIGNWHPFVGLPTFQEVTVPLAGSGKTMVRQRSTRYKLLNSHPEDSFGAYTVQPEWISEVEFEAGAASGMRSTEQTFTYDAFGNVLTRDTKRNLEGSRELVEYDVTNDTLNWLIGKVNKITTTSTAANAEVDQRVTTFDVDMTSGDIKTKTVQPGDPLAQLLVVYERNREGLVTTVTETPISGARRVTRTDYDAVEGTWPAAVTNPLGQVTRISYHPGLGVLAGVTDPNEVKTEMQYDNLGRHRATFDDKGNSVVTHYDRPSNSQGLILKWSDGTGRTGAITTDVLGREVVRTETAFDGSHELIAKQFYDAVSGKVGQIWRPYGANGGTHADDAKWSFQYDEIGRLLATSSPGEASRTIGYDGMKMTLYVDGVEKGYRIQDELGRVSVSAEIEPTSPAPNHEILTSFDYGPFGNPRHIHLPGGSTVDLDYDHVGRRTLLRDPDAGLRTTEYNAFGEVSVEHRAGQPDVVYVRDQLGRAQTIQEGTSVTTYQYDSAANGIGEIDSEQSPSGVITAFTYRPNGLPESTTWTVDNNRFRFDWDFGPDARLHGITYPDIGGSDRFGVSLSYGSDGKEAALVAAVGSAPLWSKAAVADDGQTFRQEFGDGLSSLRDTNLVTGRVTHISTGSGAIVADADGGNTFSNRMQSLGYAYFGDGTLQSRTDFVLGAAEAFDYDNVDRLKSWTVSQTGTSVAYTYDDLGNLTGRSDGNPAGGSNEIYHYGENGAGPHALSSGPLGSYTYDASGRQTARPGQPLLSYTSFDLPTQIQRADGTVVDFAYDADAVRVLKKTATSSVMSVAGLYERRADASGITHVFYLPVDGHVVGQISCAQGGACMAPVFFHRDRYGTIDTATSNGAVVGREKRDPFGRAFSIGGTQPEVAITIGFTGGEEDAETGLINLHHRLYDPRIGRFVSPDPLVKDAFGGQHYNRYAYAANNPLSFVDPSGLQERPPEEEPSRLPPIPKVDPADIGLIIGERIVTTNGVDTVTLVYVTGNARLPTASVGAGDPIAPYERLQSVDRMPVIPTFSTPASPSQQQGGRNGEGWIYLATANNGAKGAAGSARSDAYLYNVDPPKNANIQFETFLITAGVSAPVILPLLIERLLLWGAGATVATAGAAAAPTLAQQLTRLGQAGGSTTEVFTKLTQAPQLGRALSVAVGDGARALANAARPVGEVFSANIPTALLARLQLEQMAQPITTMMNGVIATEIRFSTAAVEYILPFFKVGK